MIACCCVVGFVAFMRLFDFYCGCLWVVVFVWVWVIADWFYLVVLLGWLSGVSCIV